MPDLLELAKYFREKQYSILLERGQVTYRRQSSRNLDTAKPNGAKSGNNAASVVLEDGWLQKKYLFDALNNVCRIINAEILDVFYLNHREINPQWWVVDYTLTFTTLRMKLTENDSMGPFCKQGYGFLDKPIGDLDGALRRIGKMREKKQDSSKVK